MILSCSSSLFKGLFMIHLILKLVCFPFVIVVIKVRWAITNVLLFPIAETVILNLLEIDEHYFSWGKTLSRRSFLLWNWLVIYQHFAREYKPISISPLFLTLSRNVKVNVSATKRMIKFAWDNITWFQAPAKLPSRTNYLTYQM